MTLLNKGKRKIPVATLTEGDFLESKLPVRAFATLTTPRRLSRDMLDGSFSAWVQGVQAHGGTTLGWIRSTENTPQMHIHAALIAAAPLDCLFAARLWRDMVAPRYSNAAKVELYRLGFCGLAYVLKQLGCAADDIEFSDNIAFFAAGSGKSLFRTRSAQRRQCRRIKEQFEQYADLSLSRQIT